MNEKTIEKLGCHYCSEKKPCKYRLEHCPYLIDLIEKGDLSFLSILDEVFSNYPFIQHRINRLINRNLSFFQSTHHKERMSLYESFENRSNLDMATVYIFTAREELENGFEKHTLLLLVNKISGHPKSVLTDLAEPSIISDRLFWLVVNAYLISYLGYSETKKLYENIGV